LSQSFRNAHRVFFYFISGSIIFRFICDFINSRFNFAEESLKTLLLLSLLFQVLLKFLLFKLVYCVLKFQIYNPLQTQLPHFSVLPDCVLVYLGAQKDTPTLFFLILVKEHL
jgi:hypothetical protein